MSERSMVARAVQVIDAVAASRAPATLGRLMRATALPKPTVRRIAHQLVEQGVLARTDAGYVLGARVEDWEQAFREGRAKATGVQQYLQLIAKVVGKQQERDRLRRAHK